MRYRQFMGAMIATFFLCSLAFSQIITIQPYLQDAKPQSIVVMWETSFGAESVVEYGLTDTLGQSATGISFSANGGLEMIHEVTLTGLNRFTEYYYRIKTDTVYSQIFNFKTPPFSSDHESFRILAMSDMQRDNEFPDKFSEIVNDGVLDYFSSTYGNPLTEHLAFVMIPGDLVFNGNNYGSWKDEFFHPAEEILRHVPMYPILGNHERNSINYFNYFKLPLNGSSGYNEHWWYKDYGNVRLIGLNSNSPFNNTTQLLWLDSTLTGTCSNDSIDFVFAQIHHPHRSEISFFGTYNYVQAIIDRLGSFSTNCGKPSIQFFGHTHHYARGFSRDHKHLFVDVATAGGSIAYWGEYPYNDFTEYAISEDEYGFVVIDIIDGDTPYLKIKRISRGDSSTILNNVVSDSMTVRLHSTAVNTPATVVPNGDSVVPNCFTLKAGPFSSPNNLAEHGQSHWQIDTITGNFSSPVSQHWKNFENWFVEQNNQSNDDLTDQVFVVLDESGHYHWRVRYRDRELNWSNWSTPAPFFTKPILFTSNLVNNQGAENNLDFWVLEQGNAESLDSAECGGTRPHIGNRYFSLGGVCNPVAYGKISQAIDLSSYADSVDTGIFKINFGGYFSNKEGADRPVMKLIFLDENDDQISESDSLTTLNNFWTFLYQTQIIPVSTRSVRIELSGEQNHGPENDSYIDEVYVNVGSKPCCDASTLVWTGKISSDWNNAANWQPACIPTFEEHVVIVDAAHQPIILTGNEAYARSIRVKSSGHLLIESGGYLEIFEHVTNPLTVELMSKLTINSGGEFVAGE